MMYQPARLSDAETTLLNAMLFDPSSEGQLLAGESVLTPEMVWQHPLEPSEHHTEHETNISILHSNTSVAQQNDSSSNDGGEPADNDASSISSSSTIVGSDHAEDKTCYSSWQSNEKEEQKYDAWEVLRDEYAPEFGFDYTTRVPDDWNGDSLVNSFQILGTDVNDTNTRPHVLTPPLMDALLRFVPESISGDNLWLRYSSVRDGSSLATLQQYVRAAKYTVIAIETTEGRVFGSFTSSPWRKHWGFFGSLPCFVWKLRHGRQTPCASLFDHAQMETEIDVFFAIDTDDFEHQVCHHDLLGLGNGDGMAFLVGAFLDKGTSETCPAFHSPCLAESSTFGIVNLEVWSFSPCETERDAEELELALMKPDDNVSTASPDDFYMRIGEDFESQERRDRWQYLNMMTET